MPPTTTDDRALAEVAGDLYAVLPADFVAARDARAKQAKADGEADLAARVKKLRKPSQAAWALNQVARHADDELASLVDLGRRMREAQESADGSALRTLGRELRTAVDGVARRASALAKDAGHSLGGTAAQDVAEALRAVGVDPGVAVAVRSGLLVGTVSSTGLDRADVVDAVAVPSVLDLPDDEDEDEDPSQDPGSSVADVADVADLDSARARKAERTAARERERIERERREAVAEAKRTLRRAQEAASTARDAHEAVRAELEAASSALADAQERATAAEEAESAAAAEVETTETAAAAATEALDALADD